VRAFRAVQPVDVANRRSSNVKDGLQSGAPALCT